MHRRAFGRPHGRGSGQTDAASLGDPPPIWAFGHGGRVVFAEKDIETETYRKYVCVYVFTGDVGLLKF